MSAGPTLDTPLDDAAWLDEFNTATSATAAASTAAASAAAAARASSAKPEVAHSWAAAAAAATAVQPSPLRIGGRFAKRSNSDSASADCTTTATAATTAGDATSAAAGGVLVLATAVARDVKAESQQQQQQQQQQALQSVDDSPTAGVLPQAGSSIEHSSSAFRRRQSLPALRAAASPLTAAAAATAAATAAAAVVPDESTALRDRLLAALVAVPPSTPQQQQQQFLSDSGLGDYCISGDNSLSSSAAVDILKCEGVYSEHDAATATADAGYELDVFVFATYMMDYLPKLLCSTGCMQESSNNGPLNTSSTRDNSHFPPPTADDLEIEAEIARKVQCLAGCLLKLVICLMCQQGHYIACAGVHVPAVAVTALLLCFYEQYEELNDIARQLHEHKLELHPLVLQDMDRDDEQKRQDEKDRALFRSYQKVLKKQQAAEDRRRSSTCCAGTAAVALHRAASAVAAAIVVAAAAIASSNSSSGSKHYYVLQCSCTVLRYMSIVDVHVKRNNKNKRAIR
eukprot:5542-Heterococcus_DN1.PRE.3